MLRNHLKYISKDDRKSNEEQSFMIHSFEFISSEEKASSTNKKKLFPFFLIYLKEIEAK
jgi:hypothetical protein